ncbi:MAG: extracellular solute-binding protein [Ruminococcus sp.]|uniref:extracellular solute-binding protein n=1 Tax=Ruminococcus sp. TaxID=41978 RepID=UPI0025FF1700|nr:extracellular solute-binding protein [Ruminococcus sp.]MBR5684099.1 extracellular solute-binding protein [Ruminococcus sp.]
MKKTAIFLSLAMLACSVSCSENKTELSVAPDSSSQSSQSTSDGEKTHITIALAESYDTWVGWQHAWEEIEKLNAGDGPYYVEVIHYEFDEDDHYGDSSVSRLSMDILAGKAPDVISASPFQLDKFRRNGYLTDLYPLMDSDVGMNREDFLDSVIDSVDIDGEINVIYPAFTVHTAAAKTELVGADSENWTIQQAIDAYNSFGGDFLAENYTKYDIRHYFFNGVMMDSIDCRAHTCDLNSALVPVLDFLIGLPPMEKRFGNPDIGQIHNNTALVKQLEIKGINYFYASSVLMNFQNEPMTFVGYPTNNGRGTYTDVTGGFAIMTNSKHKKEAWGAISRLFFGSTFQSDISLHAYGIPVKKSTVKNLLELEGAEVFSQSFDDSGKQSRDMSSINSAVELPDGTELKLSAEQKKQLEDFLNELEIDPFVNRNMEQIIKEESDYVFEGERSVEQCVDILQNRIGLYLSETQ